MYQAVINTCRKNTIVPYMAENICASLTNLRKEQLKFLAKSYESRREFSIIFYDVKRKNVCLKLFYQKNTIVL